MSQIICTNCQTPNPVGARFCQRCGQMLEQPQATLTSTAPQRSRSMWPWMIGTLLLLILCAAASTSLGYWGVPRAVDAIQGPQATQTPAVVTRKVVQTKMVTQMVVVEMPPQVVIQTQIVKETSIVIQTVVVEKVVVQVITATPKPGGKVTLRWFVGLSTGTDSAQLQAEQSVVDDFNASHPNIELVMEAVEYASAKDVLLTEIAAGNGPDIIGPVGRGGPNYLRGEWLDLSPYITAANVNLYDYNPALVYMYQTDEGQVGLPFVVYPSAFFYNPSLFYEANLDYPPSWYGATYNLNGVEVEWNWDTVKAVAKLLTVDTSGRNATQTGFNKNAIFQYGFTWQWENHPNYIGSYWGSGSMLVPGGYPGNYHAQAPAEWIDAWKWTYEGIWGRQPWMANSTVEGSPEFGSGSPFNSGKFAMTEEPLWFTCCASNVAWEIAVMPSSNGVVAGRLDADTFHIWKNTRHPQEAFEVLSYLVNEGTRKLIIGSDEMPAAYYGMPARPEYQQAWSEAQQALYPWAQNWSIFIDGLNFPDIPSAENWTPSYNDAWSRGYAFGDLLRNTSGLNLDLEITNYLAELEEIFNK